MCLRRAVPAIPRRSSPIPGGRLRCWDGPRRRVRWKPSSRLLRAGTQGTDRRSKPDADMAYRIGFVMEQSLGHVTHAKNLLQGIENDPEIVPTWIPVEFSAQDRWQNMPLVKSNWTLRASLRAREQ